VTTIHAIVTTIMEEVGDSDGRSGGTTGEEEPAWRYLIEHIQDAVVEFEFVDGEPVIRGVIMTVVVSYR
jgi:hypothetical protein